MDKIQHYFKYRYLLYFLSLVAAWPCVFSLMGFLPDFKITYAILFPAIIIYALAKNCKYVPAPISTIIFVQCLLWIVYYFIHSDSSYITRLAVSVAVYFLLAIQYRFKNLEFIRIFVDWQFIQVLLGAIGFVLVICHVLRPIFFFTEGNGLTGAFFGLFTTNSFYPVCRNAGFYDEPGALACWGIYALLFNKLFINNKKIEITLLIGLITTLSVAYFVQAALYLVLFYSKKRKEIIIIGILLYGMVKALSMLNSDYYNSTLGRLEFDEETGTIKGDNRITQLEEAKRIFDMSPIIGVGATNLAKYARKGKDISSNIVSSLAADGIFGQIIIYLPLLLLIKLGLTDRKYLFAALVLITGYYQRPYGAVFLINAIALFSMTMYAYLDVYAPDEVHSSDFDAES